MNIATNPDKMNSQTISDCVHAVVIARTANIVQSNTSPRTVVRTSLIALRTMIAITAAPIP